MKSYLCRAMLPIAFLLANWAGAAEVSVMPGPAGSNSSLPRLVTGAQGGVWLSWVSQHDEMNVLSYSQLTDGVWQPPQIISSGDDWFINWADFPALAVNQDSMAAHWLQLNPEGFFNYDVKARFYDADTGQWGESITVNSDGVSAEHGFVSMLPLPGGETFIAWLDGRNTRMEMDEDEGGAMTIRAGIYGRDGMVRKEWELDGRVCDCCQTGAALAASGPVVVYRDRSDEEIRDIYITRLVDGQWSNPTAVHHDDWRIEGCPVNGPAVAAEGQRVAVVWFSGKDNRPEVRLALSKDSGVSFSEPVTVASETAIGRVDVAFLDSGNIALSWMDVQGDSARLMLALYSADGNLIDRSEIARTTPSPESGFPSIASVGEYVLVAWTEVAGDLRVRVARVRF